MRGWRELGNAWRSWASPLMQRPGSSCARWKREQQGAEDDSAAGGTVAIHFRCGKNLALSHRDMGFVTLATYRRLLQRHRPRRIRLVSSCIDTGAPNRCSLCKDLTHGVARLLEKSFSDSTVDVIWNQPVMDDFVTLACSPMTFCSPSTFCFFPALLAPYALLPRTSILFAGTALPLGPSVEWYELSGEHEMLSAATIRAWGPMSFAEKAERILSQLA
ncbi:unnamed protein product [Polarella glacialis]|nr:unnamed protein product [Polarella glacialis]